MDALHGPREGVTIGRGEVGNCPDLDDSGDLGVARPPPVDPRRFGRVGVQRLADNLGRDRAWMLEVQRIRKQLSG